MKRIDQMYAFVAVDPIDNTEGIPAFPAPNGRSLLPMVGADMKRVDDLRPMTERMAKTAGMQIKLCRFEVRTELEEFNP